ncbi:MAG: hypothetical protein JXN63_08520 [Candidatus Delongbacteria bacterium]|nr:hypothetical protein [Candidatus Delongbacteria bacterium]
MKKPLTLILILMTMFLVSCGGEKKSSDSAEVKDSPQKKASISTEEGMMARLEEYGIEVPLELTFTEIRKKSGGYTAVYRSENVDEDTKLKLDMWLVDQSKELVDNGFTNRAIREKEIIVGNEITEIIFFKDGKGITISTSYNNDTKLYTLYISP